MRRETSRNPLFSRHRFADDVIIRCVRWYLRFKLSYREMAEVAWELGVLVSPSTILRWVVRYAEEFAKACLQYNTRQLKSDSHIMLTYLLEFPTTSVHVVHRTQR